MAQFNSNYTGNQIETAISKITNASSNLAHLSCGIGTCSTAAATAAKVVTLSNYVLVTNGIVAVTFQYDVPANATLNINSKGAKAIYYKGAAITADVIKAGDTVMFAYNGSQYVVTSLGGGASGSPNETVKISLTQIGGNSADLTGASITITDDDSGDTLYTGTWGGAMLTTKIDVNTNYTVSVNDVTGYFVHHTQSYTAVYQNTRYINFNYAVNGIYIEDTDGNLYTNNGWNPNKTANSIVFGSDVAVYRIALSEAQIIAATSTSTVNTFKTYLVADIGTGYVDKSKRDHARAVSANKACNTYSASYAAPYCDLYTFPNGETGGLLPSTDILRQIVNNKTNINKCLNTVGGIVISSDSVYRSSTYSGNVLQGIVSDSAGISNPAIDATGVAGYNLNTRAIAEY